MSPNHPSEHQDLTPEEQQFEADKKALQDAEQQLGIQGLVGRLKFGLDPAAMMVVPGVREQARHVIDQFGTTVEKVWPLVKELHEKGPWNFVDRLSSSADPEIRVYLVLAEACNETSWPGYNPEQYLADRARVVEQLRSFNAEQFEQRKQELIKNRLKGFEDKSEGDIKVAIVEGDPALVLSLKGFRGAVVRAGEMRFAQSASIPDDLLIQAGYAKGFGEVYEPTLEGGKGGFARVPVDTKGARVIWVKQDQAGKDLYEMVPGIKRIAPGYVLTYTDEELALSLVKSALKNNTSDTHIESVSQDPWERAQADWEKAKDQPQLTSSLQELEKYKVDLNKPEKPQDPNLLVLLSGKKEDAENLSYPWKKERKVYGAMPHFEKRDEIVGGFASEAQYFSKHYSPGDKTAPPWRDPSYAEGALLSQLKFGKKLSEMAEEMLKPYPSLGKKGKEINIFGLSGSGKSTVSAAMREMLGSEAVMIDNDTVRFNLFGKLIKEVELAAGSSLEEVRDHLMHNNISGTLYYLLNYVTKELKDRGYTVIFSSTSANKGADETYYIEHPDGVDPLSVPDADPQDPESASKQKAIIDQMAKDLFQRTQGRVDGADDFNWDEASTETDLNKMKTVTVQVPEFVHGRFVANVKDDLKNNPQVIKMKNPKMEDPSERNKYFQEQFQHLRSVE